MSAKLSAGKLEDDVLRTGQSLILKNRTNFSNSKSKACQAQNSMYASELWPPSEQQRE